ncbi:hypothetical protein DL764_000590 [Monosporascus ibericus]|uniref:FAD-binding domain-containing protein n=1 Tax=Monosporascus ibericus TaxID=155417 RepID=A0A4Q4TW99_9PEZI|nr:hypothetical protein DL764_000590 [Monosporascus ibericus]
MHVLIAGAGLGGLSLAQFLREQGISYEIFERDIGEKVRFQRWTIAPHVVINKLTSSVPSDLPGLRDSTNHLEPLKLPAQVAMYMPGRMDRVGFQDKRLKRIEDGNDGVAVYFYDGTSAKGDILVGADGVNNVGREHLIRRPSTDVLGVVPLATIVGENFMQADPDISKPDHWLQKAGQQEKLDHVLKATAKTPSSLREIFEMRPGGEIRREPHVWCELELEKIRLPAGHVILVRDASHVMTPFKGEGGRNSFSQV